MSPSVLFWGLVVLMGSSEGLYSLTHSMSPRLHPRLYYGCYGDIQNMKRLEHPVISSDPSTVISSPGVSQSWKRLHESNNPITWFTGIHGSEMFAEMDLRAIMPYQNLIKEVGLRHCVDPALVAAIISRESHGGTVLQDGWDHTGAKFGLMQLNKQAYKPYGAWDSKEHLLQGVGILANNIQTIQKKFPTWNATQHLKGGLSAFKAGSDAISSSMDINHDLTDDLLARAKFYKRHGF